MDVLVMWDEALLSYDMGDHPLDPVRVELTMALANQLGVLSRESVRVTRPVPASDDVLRTVHDATYIEVVKASGAGRRIPGFGLGPPDNPTFAGMHESSALIAGATRGAVEAVWRGEVDRAVNISGGLHHAMPDRASGFCVYNDPAIGIHRALELGAERVAYVDIDVHHGDGVQEIFYNDPRVLTVSVHESPRTLFPGTGFPDETGGPGAPGSAVNLPLPPGTDDTAWLRAYHAVVPSVVRAFRPQLLFTQCGADTYRHDPLANLRLTVDGQRAAHLALRELAMEAAGGKWVATGGGGYALVECVPRAWTHLLATLTGDALDPSLPTPQEWRDLARERRPGQPVPATMSDGGDTAYRPWQPGDTPDAVDRAIASTRRHTFPFFGLDPDDPRD